LRPALITAKGKTKSNANFKISTRSELFVSSKALLKTLMKPKFLIASPGYNKKNYGIVVLHDLCHALNELGYEAAIAFFGAHPEKDGEWRWFVCNHPAAYKPGMKFQMLDADNPVSALQEYTQNGIMIYPDLIAGNPLGAPRVCKYVLYTAYDTDFGSDYVLTFSKLFRKPLDYHGVLFSVNSDINMHSRDVAPFFERTFDATYFGKAPSYSHKIPETIVLEREWPTDKEQLGVFLRNCRFLFTWDCVTSTLYDAIRCGCVPVLLHDDQIPRDRLNTGELGLFPSISLRDYKDKESVVYDRTIVQMDMQNFAQKIAYYETSWLQRVDEFAKSCLNYFK
jgi:hypothetical protein